jgi:hypothetical protein
MRTVGMTLFAVERCSGAGAWMFAQDSRSVHGLLYPTAPEAVGDNRWHDHRHLPGGRGGYAYPLGRRTVRISGRRS